MEKKKKEEERKKERRKELSARGPGLGGLKGHNLNPASMEI